MAKAGTKKVDKKSAKKTEDGPELKGRIRKLCVKNFRAIGSPGIELDIDDIVVLVGPNNSGKSSILRAYELIMLDGSKDGWLKAEDFPDSKPGQGVFPEIELFTEVADGEPGDTWISWEGENKDKKIVRERWVWEVPGPGKRSGWNVKNGAWDEKVPWGFAAVANSRRPLPHTVRSFDPPEEQARQIHDLLKTAVVEHAKTIIGDDGEPAYQGLLTAVRTFQEKAVAGSSKKIEDVEGRLNEIIAAIFDDHEVKFDQPTDTNENAIKLFPIAGKLLLGPKDGHKSGMEHQGSGTRRTMLWAALRILSEEKQSTSSRPHLLLIDEPELCLHPNAVRDACKVLYDLAAKSGWQVMITTHSPVFIDLARDNTSIIRVERSGGNVGSVSLFRPKKVSLGEDDKENLKLLNLYDPYVAEFFFGGRVVVVEGDTEFSAFRYVMNKYPGEFRGVHIVRARGKATIVSLVKILNHFKTPFAILHDADSATITVTDKKGAVKEMVNPAWTTNSKILEATKAAKPGTVRLVSSIPNFERAYFDQKVTGEKPYTAIQNLGADEAKLETIRSLLKGLVDHSVALPANALSWGDLKELEAAIKS